jgi:hypothetical protein
LYGSQLFAENKIFPSALLKEKKDSENLFTKNKLPLLLSLKLEKKMKLNLLYSPKTSSNNSITMMPLEKPGEEINWESNLNMPKKLNKKLSKKNNSKKLDSEQIIYKFTLYQNHFYT